MEGGRKMCVFSGKLAISRKRWKIRPRLVGYYWSLIGRSTLAFKWLENRRLQKLGWSWRSLS